MKGELLEPFQRRLGFKMLAFHKDDIVINRLALFGRRFFQSAASLIPHPAPQPSHPVSSSLPLIASAGTERRKLGYQEQVAFQRSAGSREPGLTSPRSPHGPCRRPRPWTRRYSRSQLKCQFSRNQSLSGTGGSCTPPPGDKSCIAVRAVQDPKGAAKRTNGARASRGALHPASLSGWFWACFSVGLGLTRVVVLAGSPALPTSLPPTRALSRA